MRSKENFQIKSNGKIIVGEISYPEKLPAPAVLLLHGFTNDSEDCPINRDLFKILPQKGYIAVQFDFIGSGQSDGMFRDKTLSKMFNNYKDIMNYIKKNKNIKEIGVVGKSIKGIFPIMDNDSRVKTIALMATAVKPTMHFYRTRDNKKGLVKFGIAKSKNPKGELELTQDFFKELPEIENKVMKNIGKIKNIIHFQGTKDLSVPYEQGQYYFLKNTLREPFKSVLIENVGHQFEGKEKFVIKEIIDWFNKYLK